MRVIEVNVSKLVTQLKSGSLDRFLNGTLKDAEQSVVCSCHFHMMFNCKTLFGIKRVRLYCISICSPSMLPLVVHCFSFIMLEKEREKQEMEINLLL